MGENADKEVPEFQNILLEIDGQTAVITLNTPKSMNALSNQTLNEFGEALTFVETDNDIRGIIITGAGKAFAAGADIAQMRNYTPDDVRSYAAKAQGLFNRIENYEKPVIAAVNGFALGGGCELSMSCDWRIASEKAKFGQPEAKLGVIPCFGGTQRLPRLVGLGMAKNMIYTGRMVSGAEAEKIGLVNRVTAPEDLLNEAKADMAMVCRMAPLAIRYSKIAINASTETELKAGLEFEKDLVALTFTTEDHNEGINAFLEKRDPEFKCR